MCRVCGGVSLVSVLLFRLILGESLFISEFEQTLVYKQVPFIEDPLLAYSEFGPLLNKQKYAKNVNESTYPWMALMYRSKSRMLPYTTLVAEQPYCSAICIQDRIFMTSAKCVYNHRVEFVWIFMDLHIFYAQAFVMPNLFSKQAFDDIGFVVVKKDSSYTRWNTANVYSKNKRNDHNFAWFDKSDLNNPNGRTFKAIGYAQKELPPSAAIYLLFELDVVVDIQSCVEFHTKRHLKSIIHRDGFHVPCYYYCTLKEWRKNVADCGPTLSPHGGAVYNPKTKEVVGIITWGSQTQGPKKETPIGFAVPNTKMFYEDYKCAQKIRDDNKEYVQGKYYQKLCDKN